MTTREQAPHLLNTSDSVVAKAMDAALERLALFTVYLFQPPRAVGQRGSPVGTGVLVQLVGKHFILTAGHCVKRGLAVGLADRRHESWVPETIQIEKSEEPDCGFIEIAERDGKSLSAHEHAFLGPDRMHVAEPAAIQEDDDRYLLYGYPAVAVQSDMDPPTNWYAGFYADTVVAGRQGTRPFPLVASPDSGTAVDFCIDPGRASALVPELTGMSGCGCWKSGAIDNYDRWSPEAMKLAGIYVGRPRVNDEPDRWARVVLVSAHLRLLAQKIPSVADEIRDRWPWISSAADRQT